MTVSDYLDHLAEIALGWLGWSEAELMDADLNSIEIGHRGKIKMLQAVFGEDKSKGKSKPKPDADELRSFAMTHNAVKRKGK